MQLKYFDIEENIWKSIELAEGESLVSDGEKGFINTNLKPYKVYVALLTQSGTDDPTALVLENTIGNIVWNRDSVGVYYGTLSGSFTDNKTWTNPTVNDNASLQLMMYRVNVNQVVIVDSNGDNGLVNTSIEIRVYNAEPA